MSILFLDVDGVLNHRNTRAVTCCGCTGIEFNCAEQLRRILRETGCAIVVSSTWRRWNALMGELWCCLGEDVESRCIGLTPVLEDAERGLEIQAWLDRDGYKGVFVIVDDDSDMAHLMPHLVKTDNNVGLTEERAGEIIKRLNE